MEFIVNVPKCHFLKHCW